MIPKMCKQLLKLGMGCRLCCIDPAVWHLLQAAQLRQLVSGGKLRGAAAFLKAMLKSVQS